MSVLASCMLVSWSVLAAEQLPAVSVKPVLGVPTFVVGDQPFTTPCFETYVPQQRYFEQFAKAGVKLFSFNTNVAACDYGHSKPTWLAADQWDYSDFDERMERVLAANPDALVMPRVNLGTPRWWLDAHPDEMELLNDGSALYKDPNRNPTLPKDRAFPSLASAQWRQDMAVAIERFLEHIQSKGYEKRIFGYFLAGLDTEEWYHWSSGSDQLAGYSVATRAAFRDWLRKKYGSDDALQKSWNRSDVMLASVKTPAYDERFDTKDGTLRDPAKKMNVIDWYLFYNDLVPETVDYFAKVFRDKTQGAKALGAFYGYMYEFRGDPEYGHNALSRYNASKNLDFIFVTASYGEREFAAGGDYSRSPAYSVQLHGKLWYHDNDVVSYLAPQVMKKAGMNEENGWNQSLEHHLKVLGYTQSPEQTQWMYRRSLGFSICNGAYESYFDLHGGYYDSPELMEEVTRLNRVAEVAKRYPRTSNSEILVLSDEASCSYSTFRSELLASALAETQFRFIKVGAPMDHVLMSDLDLLDTTRYKLVIFLNCYHMSEADRANIKNKILNNGRHVLWCYAPGYFKGNTQSAEAMQQIAGLHIVPPAAGAPAGPLQIALKDGVLGLGASVVGPSRPVAQPVYVDDPQAETLGVAPGTEKATFARRDMGGWTSYYTVSADMPPAVYRALARKAGVHVYNDRDDSFYANSAFACIHANGAGERTIRFPWACDIYDMVREEYLATNADHLTYTFQNGETLILRWKTRL